MSCGSLKRCFRKLRLTKADFVTGEPRFIEAHNGDDASAGKGRCERLAKSA